MLHFSIQTLTNVSEYVGNDLTKGMIMLIQTQNADAQMRCLDAT